MSELPDRNLLPGRARLAGLFPARAEMAWARHARRPLTRAYFLPLLPRGRAGCRLIARGGAVFRADRPLCDRPAPVGTANAAHAAVRNRARAELNLDRIKSGSSQAQDKAHHVGYSSAAGFCHARLAAGDALGDQHVFAAEPSKCHCISPSNTFAKTAERLERPKCSLFPISRRATRARRTSGGEQNFGRTCSRFGAHRGRHA